MTIRNTQLTAAAFLMASAACFAAESSATVLFNVTDHFASGPISLLSGQTASACATNPDESPVAVLIALLQADNSNLLASRELTLQPGTGACLSYNRGVPPAVNAQSPNVYAVAVPSGRLDSSGRIVQDRPGGGGCIVASLQIQMFTPNNTPGQTLLYAQMIKHHHPLQPNRD